MWYKVNNSATIAMVTEEFITYWSSDAVKGRDSRSRDLYYIIDTTQGMVSV